MTQETEIAPEEQVKRADAAIAEAKKAVAAAEKAALAFVPSDGIDKMQELGAAVTKARTALDRAEASRKVAENAVKVAEWTQRAQALAPINQRILDAARLTDEERAMLTEMGIETLHGQFAVDPANESHVRPVGPGVPGKAPKAASTGSRAGRGGKWTFNGQSASDFLKGYLGQNITEKVTVDMVLERPASYGLTDYARRFAEKIGVTPQPVE